MGLRKAAGFTAAAFAAALAAIYGFWLFQENGRTVAGFVGAAIVCLLFGFAAVRGIRAVFTAWEGGSDADLAQSLGARSLRQGYRHPVLRLFLALFFCRLLVFVAAYALLVLQQGYEGALLDTLSLWLKGDAPHYLGIAENWYVTEGDPRFHIVFFPLYPIIVRAVRLIAGNTFVSGLFVSVACTVGAGMLLYELALLDLDRAAAKRAVRMQMLLPAAFLLNAPMSDGLFLLLSIFCIFLARKKRYALACLVGGLAAFTRVLGIVLLVPVFVELIADAARMKKEGGNPLFFLPPRLIALLAIPMGFLCYLLVNQQVTGSPFTFLIYQSEHWNQRMGWFFNTAAYQTDYFLGSVRLNPPHAFGLWLPNLLFLIGAPVALIAAQRAKKLPPPDDEGGAYRLKLPAVKPYRLRASYQAYMLAYYIVGMGATWLLSAPRYMTCCFPLSIALAAATQRRGPLLLIYAALLILQIGYCAAYVAGWPIY